MQVTLRLYTYMKCYIFSAIMMLFALAFASTPIMLSTFIICSVIFASAGLIIYGIAECLLDDEDDLDSQGS